MADALASVPGIVAIVLGGSRARRTHHEASDVDLGLYYRAEGLDLDALARASRAFSDTGQVEIVGPGGWGPWVNGGGWLTVNGTPVDWILRDLDRVHEQADRARRGEFAFHPQPGHPRASSTSATPARSPRAVPSPTPTAPSPGWQPISTRTPMPCASRSSTTCGRPVSW